MESLKISIGIPTYSQMHVETTMCLIYAIQQLKADIHLNFRKGTYVHALRNDIVKEAFNKKADYLMFLDSDLSFQPDGIYKLLQHNKDIVGGMYNMKGLPPVSTIKLADENGKLKKVDGALVPDTLFECYAIPAGFMLIKLDAIKDIKNPFDFAYDEDGELVGEDVNFCKKIHDKGLKVWCDPTIKIGHIGEFLY